MAKTIFAHTPPGHDYPPYLNMRIESGEIIITIRAAKKDDGSCGETVDFRMSRAIYCDMRDAMREWGGE